MLVLDVKSGILKDAEIVRAVNNDLPLKKEGWNFNWKIAFKKSNSEIYLLRLKQDKDKVVQGAIQLVFLNGMINMELIEVHPNNRGKNKILDFVAGCLIAFGCRESFKLDNDYEGFLTFESKTVLIDIYREKYGATQTFRNKMYISPKQGIKLISKYLKHKK